MHDKGSRLMYEMLRRLELCFNGSLVVTCDDDDGDPEEGRAPSVTQVEWMKLFPATVLLSAREMVCI